jgi:hypothetical protein
MIHSSRRRESETKAIAEVLAMIADAHPELAPHHPRPVRETDEWIWESAAEFCAALDRYAGRRRRVAPMSRRHNLASNAIAAQYFRRLCHVAKLGT